MPFLFFPVRSSASPSTTIATTPGVDMTGQDLVREALLEIGALNPTEAPSGDDASYVLSKLNRLFDRWNAMPGAAFQTGVTELVTTPSLSPHTIGPSGTWTLAVRPTAIVAANLLIGDVRSPITIRKAQWYESLSQPTLETTIPTDLFYEPAVPNGKCWLYPVPSVAASIELWLEGFFGAMALTDRLVAPQGYRDAIVKTLAEECVGPFRVPMPPDLPRQAREARAICWANNEEIPDLDTRDGGMPGGCGGGYNYLTGLIE